MTRIRLAEVFQAGRVIDRHTGTPYLAALSPERPLRLLDVRGTWPARAGVRQILNTGSHRRAHEWSRQSYTDYPDLDGVLPLGRSGHHRRDIMLYERAAAALPTRPLLNEPLTHTGSVLPLRRAAHRFGYLLI